MLESLGSIFSTVTGRIPTGLLTGITGEWTVQVKKKDDQTPGPDNWFDKLKTGISDQLSAISNSILKAFNLGEKEEWVDIASFDSFISMNGVHDSQIVENAVEKGSFRSANKIIQPSTFVVELAKGGWKAGIENTRNNLLKYQGALKGKDGKVNSTIKCRIVTPFGVINELNLKKIDYNFSQEGGAYLLIARLEFREIKSYEKVLTNDKSMVKSASLSNTVSGGLKSLKG
jgi:hypothetical protein